MLRLAPFRLLLCLLLFVVATAAQAQDDAVHDEIRAMRDRAIAAFEARDVEALFAELDDRILFTAMNNETVAGKEALTAYYARMMDGSAGLVSDLQVAFETDALATLLAGNQAAVASGSVVAGFKMRAGLEFSVPLRWTATLSRDSGAWKIVALHFSANIFDNPIDSALRSYLWLMLAAAVAVGLVAGLLLRRRRG
jgi:ketosteroid isomerase-like protein